jgi:hypothetical protein
MKKSLSSSGLVELASNAIGYAAAFRRCSQPSGQRSHDAVPPLQTCATNRLGQRNLAVMPQRWLLSNRLTLFVDLEAGELKLLNDMLAELPSRAVRNVLF